MISTGQVLTELCTELSSLGVKVNVFCAQPTLIDRNTRVEKEMTHQGVHITRLWSTRFPKLNLLGKLCNQLSFISSVFFALLRNRKKTSPLLISTDPPYLGFLCALLKPWLRGPLVYLNFDIYPDTLISLKVISEKNVIARVWNSFNRFSFRRMDQIVLIGRCMRERLKSRLGEDGLEKTSVIPLWSDERLIAPKVNHESFYLKEWCLEGKFVVLYSGNMGRFHEIETLLKVVLSLKDHPQIHFVFVGEGHQKKSIQTFVAEHDLKNIQIHSYVSREKLPELLSLCHVGLVSLKMGQEGLSVPSKTFGLMAAAKPVIAVMSSQSEISHIIQEEGFGEVVEPGEVKKLEELVLKAYGNSDQWKKMGVKGRQALEKKYSLKKAAEKYLSLFRSLEN